jgi:phage gpG-like protein
VKIKVRREHSNRWEELKERNREAGKVHVRVGVFGDEKHEGSEDLTLVELAAIHEFGSPAAGIPERSFIRATINAKHDEIKKLLHGLAKQVVRGEITAERGLNLIGTYIAAEMKKTITQRKTVGPEPQELKQATIDRKGSSTPLLDTAQLKNSITHVVVNGDEKVGAE